MQKIAYEIRMKLNFYKLRVRQSFQIIKNTTGFCSEERKWRKWADEVFVHTLSPNVYRSREEALQAFNWFSEVLIINF